MDYADAIDWLYAAQGRGIKLGLETTEQLADRMAPRWRALRFLHVAGTNGKGSVCAMATALLRAAGFRVGCYTSPHLVHFSERITLDGVGDSEDVLANELTQLRGVIESLEMRPTFFECTTVLALMRFTATHPDFVVWETGLGGRLDSTNIVTPLVSLITRIGLDHQEYLGNSLKEIALEKAGIIKPGVPVCSVPQELAAVRVLEDSALKAGADITFVDRYEPPLPLALAGAHQQFNAALAIAACERAGVSLEPEHVRSVLSSVRSPGRFQLLEPNLYLDGAHNPAAAEALVQTWMDTCGSTRPVVVVGLMRDKDAVGVISALARVASRFVTVSAQSPRALDAESIAGVCRQCGAHDVQAVDSLAAFFHDWDGVQPVLITGSFFLVGEALALRSAQPFRRTAQ